MENYLFKVLWVEDDPRVSESYPLEAENYDLHLVPFRCWREAESALKENISQWDAVILDAKCKLEPDSPDNAVSFLLNAQTSLMSICKEKNRHINYYILSGGAENEINDCILDTNVRYWDKDMHKKYYSKDTDRELLFRRIRAHAKESQHYQIRSVYYKPVFDAISEARLSPETLIIMEDLLTPIHFPNLDSLPSKDYNNRILQVRRILEYIFRSMVDCKILPPEVIAGSKGKVNLTWSSLLLSGKEVKEGDTNISPKESIIPTVMGSLVWRMIDIVGSGVHTSSLPKDVRAYWDETDNSPFLVQSFAMQLCDVIVWYNAYKQGHSDLEKNEFNYIRN